MAGGVRAGPDSRHQRLVRHGRANWRQRRCDCGGPLQRTNVYFLKLADYMADERAIPVEGLVAEIKEARQRDEAFIASGTIEAPVVYTAYPRMPNLLALNTRGTSNQTLQIRDTKSTRLGTVRLMFAGNMIYY